MVNLVASNQNLVGSILLFAKTLVTVALIVKRFAAKIRKGRYDKTDGIVALIFHDSVKPFKNTHSQNIKNCSKGQLFLKNPAAVAGPEQLARDASGGNLRPRESSRSYPRLSSIRQWSRGGFRNFTRKLLLLRISHQRSTTTMSRWLFFKSYTSEPKAWQDPN